MNNEEMNNIAEGASKPFVDFSDWYNRQSRLVKSGIILAALATLVIGFYILDIPIGKSSLPSLMNKTTSLPSIAVNRTGTLPSLLVAKSTNQTDIYDILCTNIYSLNQTNLTYGRITCAKTNITGYDCICYTSV